MKKYVILFLFTSHLSIPINIIVHSDWNDLWKRSVDVEATMHYQAAAGFFAEFGKVVSSLIYYERDGINSFKVLWTHPFFPFKNDPKSNGWDSYFEPIVTDNTADVHDSTHTVGNAQTHELHDQVCVAHWVRYDDYLPYRLFAHEKIKKHIRIKPHILKEVESFYDKHMKDNVCIGVHVRHGKSHVQEAPGGHPGHHVYAGEINRLLSKHKNDNVKIYFASDSHAVVNYFKSVYGDKLVYLDTYRAQGSEDPGLMYEGANYWMSHPEEFHKKKPGYRGGLGVLMDCLLLAKCDYFIHITSNVATYVCFFNPYIKSIFLPRSIKFKHCRYRGNPKVRNPFLNPI